MAKKEKFLKKECEGLKRREIKTTNMPSLKCDQQSMEHPFFVLSTKKAVHDIRVYQHRSNKITIMPSAIGAANIADKDVLIYCAAVIMKEIRDELRKEGNKTVRFVASDFFKATGRDQNGKAYASIKTSLDRLMGTFVKTNIPSAGKVRTTAWGLIDSYDIIEDKETGKLGCIEVTISDYFHAALTNRQLLTYTDDYFRLSKSIDKRLYEIARKHCGRQNTWRCSIETLFKKSGSTGALKEFRRELNDVIKRNILPGYRVHRTLEDKNEVEFWRIPESLI